jgi:hypothetical protein
MWVLSLSYVARDAGTQFNRKSFVRTLLERIAASQAVEYDALVATLERGLRATGRHRPLASSLPALIVEIVQDLDRGAAPVQEVIADVTDVADPAALAGLIRRHGHDRQVLERLVRQCDEDTLRSVLRLLAQDDAAAAIDAMQDLRRLHGIAPLLAMDDAALARMLWTVSLRRLAADGARIERGRFARILLQEIALRAGVDAGALQAIVRQAMREAETAGPVASALERVEEKREPVFRPDARQIKNLEQDDDSKKSHLALDDIVGDVVREDAAETTAPRADPVDETTPAAAVALIRRHDGERAMLELLIERRDVAFLRVVLRLLAPADADAMLAIISDLERIHRNERLLPLGEQEFGRLIWLGVLGHAARHAGAAFDLRVLVRLLLHELAERAGTDAPALIAALGRRLTGDDLRGSLTAALDVAIGELAREAPAADDPRRIVGRYERLDALRHYLQRLPRS